MTATAAPPQYDFERFPEISGPETESPLSAPVSYDALGRIMLPGGSVIGHCPPLMPAEERDREVAQLQAAADRRKSIEKAALDAAQAAVKAAGQQPASPESYRADAPVHGDDPVPITKRDVAPRRRAPARKAEG